MEEEDVKVFIRNLGSLCHSNFRRQNNFGTFTCSALLGLASLTQPGGEAFLSAYFYSAGAKGSLSKCFPPGQRWLNNLANGTVVPGEEHLRGTKVLAAEWLTALQKPFFGEVTLSLVPPEGGGGKLQ